MFGLLGSISGLVLPAWAKYAAMAVAATVLYFLGQLHGERVAGQAHIDYVNKQAGQTVKIVQAQAKVVTVTETVYKDKIQKIYVQGEKIETVIHDLVVPADDDRFSVNIGFVRVYNAAWAGDPPGPANDLDREPAEVPLSAIGSTEAANATSCLAWRKETLGWREFYAGQQEAINHVKPAWYVPEPE